MVDAVLGLTAQAVGEHALQAVKRRQVLEGAKATLQGVRCRIPQKELLLEVPIKAKVGPELSR